MHSTGSTGYHLPTVLGSGDQRPAHILGAENAQLARGLVLGARESGEVCLIKAWSDRTRGNWLQTETMFRLGIRKKFFLVRVVRPWYRLPREAVFAPSLERFKTMLEGPWSNLGQ